MALKNQVFITDISSKLDDQQSYDIGMAVIHIDEQKYLEQQNIQNRSTGADNSIKNGFAVD